MPQRKSNSHEISEQEFDNLTYGRDDTVCIEYDRTTGILKEDGYIELDREDEELIGQDLINSFIDGDKDIMYAHNDKLDINYEFTRWSSNKKK